MHMSVTTCDRCASSTPDKTTAIFLGWQNKKNVWICPTCYNGPGSDPFNVKCYACRTTVQISRHEYSRFLLSQENIGNDTIIPFTTWRCQNCSPKDKDSDETT